MSNESKVTMLPTCPFCKGQWMGTNGDDNGARYVVCQTCGAQGPKTKGVAALQAANDEAVRLWSERQVDYQPVAVKADEPAETDKSWAEDPHPGFECGGTCAVHRET